MPSLLLLFPFLFFLYLFIIFGPPLHSLHVSIVLPLSLSTGGVFLSYSYREELGQLPRSLGHFGSLDRIQQVSEVKLQSQLSEGDINKQERNRCCPKCNNVVVVTPGRDRDRDWDLGHYFWNRSNERFLSVSISIVLALKWPQLTVTPNSKCFRFRCRFRASRCTGRISVAGLQPITFKIYWVRYLNDFPVINDDCIRSGVSYSTCMAR